MAARRCPIKLLGQLAAHLDGANPRFPRPLRKGSVAREALRTRNAFLEHRLPAGFGTPPSPATRLIPGHLPPRQFSTSHPISVSS